jgi:hypothetical protein
LHQSGRYPQQILSRSINWDLIGEQYDQMVKYSTALRLVTAETEAILRRFTRNNVQHPTYKALAELGKAIETTFVKRVLGVGRPAHSLSMVQQGRPEAISLDFQGNELKLRR